ncbi:hypothetical protein ACLKA6_005819 [Drosophila palustris]
MVQEVPTRWNSALHMLKRVLCIREHLSTVLLNTSKAPSPLNEDQFDSMKEICSVLDHFEAATFNTSSAKSTTVNLIIPTTLGLMIKLDSALPVTQKPKTIRSDAIIELRQYFEQQNASREADPLEYWKSSKIKTYIKTVASKQSLWRNA